MSVFFLHITLRCTENFQLFSVYYFTSGYLMFEVSPEKVLVPQCVHNKFNSKILIFNSEDTILQA